MQGGSTGRIVTIDRNRDVQDPFVPHRYATHARGAISSRVVHGACMVHVHEAYAQPQRWLQSVTSFPFLLLLLLLLSFCWRRGMFPHTDELRYGARVL
jgi:hypothetical protein